MPEQTRIPERQHSMRRADWSRIFFFDRMPLRTAGAGMCARRRSHFRSLRRKKVTKERATPLLVSPSLRCGATCGARRKAGSAQTRFAQTARGPDPLCACAPRHGQRGLGAKQPFGPSLRSASARALGAAQALGSDHDAAQRNSCSDPNPGTVSAVSASSSDRFQDNSKSR